MAARSKHDAVELAWNAIEHAPLGFVELDRTRRILRANRTFCGWLGYAPEQLRGRRFLDFVPARYHEPWRARCRQGGSPTTLRLQIICGDGRPARFELHACEPTRPRGSRSGGCQMILSNRDDVPPAGRRPTLRETNARLCELVQRLSHLRAIEARALSESLGERLGRELGELRGDLSRLALPGSVSPRQAALRRRVLTRLERAQDQLRRLRYELAPPGVAELGLAPALTRRVEEFAARTGLTMECRVGELPDRLPARAAALLERVLDEGLRNVERHAGARRVEVDTVANGDWTVLRVSDDGAGLNEADRRQPRRLGLLGLEVCLAEVGGTLQVTSQPGRGTTLVAAVPMELRTPPRRRVTAGAD